MREVLERIFNEITGSTNLEQTAKYLAMLSDEEIILHVISKGRLGNAVSASHAISGEECIRIWVSAMRRDRDSKQVEL